MEVSAWEVKQIVDKFEVEMGEDEIKENAEAICDLRNYLSTVDPRELRGPNKFKCEFCNEEFFRKVTLSKHIRVTHLKKETYSCSDCPLCFRSVRALSTHVIKEHTKFECEICGFKTTSKVLADTHIKVHTGKCKFYCPLCFAGFTKEKAFHLHSIRKHGRTFGLLPVTP